LDRSLLSGTSTLFRRSLLVSLIKFNIFIGAVGSMIPSLVILLFFASGVIVSHSWVIASVKELAGMDRNHIYKITTACRVLTDRQMQFWEDVDDGLNGIEEFYQKNGQNILRIREFSKRFVLEAVKNRNHRPKLICF
jgi:hypothetical protein